MPPAVDEMRALDGGLWWSLGFGLEIYMGTGQPNSPGKPMVSYKGQRRPFFKATPFPPKCVSGIKVRSVTDHEQTEKAWASKCTESAMI